MPLTAAELLRKSVTAAKDVLRHFHDFPINWERETFRSRQPERTLLERLKISPGN
jgi:hypothetical protein